MISCDGLKQRLLYWTSGMAAAYKPDRRRPV